LVESEEQDDDDDRKWDHANKKPVASSEWNVMQADDELDEVIALQLSLLFLTSPQDDDEDSGEEEEIAPRSTGKGKTASSRHSIVESDVDELVEVNVKSR
jgi:hypothetical protein